MSKLVRRYFLYDYEVFSFSRAPCLPTLVHNTFIRECAAYSDESRNKRRTTMHSIGGLLYRERQFETECARLFQQSRAFAVLRGYFNIIFACVQSGYYHR